MRILFLDIDGVLNSRASFLYYRHLEEKGLLEVVPFKHMGDLWCPICTNNLRLLLSQLPQDVRIVLSSTWRLGRSMPKIRDLFTERGVDASRVIGKTGSYDDVYARGDEIQRWLDSVHPEVKDFVILDDDADMGVLLPHLVQTSHADGLTLTKVEEVLAVFTKDQNVSL